MERHSPETDHPIHENSEDKGRASLMPPALLEILKINAAVLFAVGLSVYFVIKGEKYVEQMDRLDERVGDFEREFHRVEKRIKNSELRFEEIAWRRKAILRQELDDRYHHLDDEFEPLGESEAESESLGE